MSQRSIFVSAAELSRWQMYTWFYTQPLRFHLADLSSSGETPHKANPMFFPEADFTSLAPGATSSAVAPVTVTCSWTPYLPSHLSSVTWVVLVDTLVSFIWVSMVAAYPSCFQGGGTSAPVVTTCGLRIGDGDFTGLIGEVEILPAGETDLLKKIRVSISLIYSHRVV